MAVAVVVAVACAGWAWLTTPPELTAADAVEVAESALAAGDVDARVDPDPGAGTYTTSSGDDVAVWKVMADVEGEPVAVWIARDDGQPVFLDDRASGGDGQVLADSAVVAIGDHRSNPVLDRQIRRNLVVTAAAVLLVVVAVQIAGRIPARPSPPAPVPEGPSNDA